MNKDGLLVKVRGNGRAFAQRAKNAFGAAPVRIKPVLTVPANVAAGGPALRQDSKSTWLRVDIPQMDDNPWDTAHNLSTGGDGSGFGADGGADLEFVEPDIWESWLPIPPETDSQGIGALADRCAFFPQDRKGGKATGPGPAWNQGDAFSEFIAARGRFGEGLEANLRRIIIAHLDTGYDPNHVTLPRNLDTALQKNFVDDDTPNDAKDRTPPGFEIIRNRGHGTATLALLAGEKVGDLPNWTGFADFFGGAPFARIIPIRIADWVVRLAPSTMVQGIDYARKSGAHVLSMSMGGVTSAALVDAVNLAYDAGVVMVTAAGNNRPGSPTSIVFPARYRRVLAACGVMADGHAYAGLKDGTMEGNFGPGEKMKTALGAYTPNVPWAVIDCSRTVGMDGSGTSSATPQIASAAALWLAEHLTEVMEYRQPWMRVEAVRRALFTSAAKSTANMTEAETFEKIGNGVLKANAALALKPAAAEHLHELPPAEDGWPWLDVLFGGGVSVAPTTRGRNAMFKLELTQMAQRVAAVDKVIPDNDLPAGEISSETQRRYLEAALDAGNPSKSLRAKLEKVLGRTQVAGTTSELSLRVLRKTKKMPPPKRRLRVYALDPSVAKSLDYVSVNETTLCLNWEEGLNPGPVGEYLEVIDVDPASNRLYDPVDLNEPKLLAQDGWPPSEGNPEFHQQMVYAVGMSTINHFEEALGRKALWAPHRTVTIEKDGDEKHDVREVPRLRVYPHALRAKNAYYSPEKVALLFGYFQAETQAGDATAPGTMVFSCLSSDIIVHETSHALLDGLHRRLQEASNPDVPAFHEAFADIVALFQHFAMPELVRFQIAQARGRLSAARLLGGLAKQFGEGIQRGGALRDYLGDEVKALSYATTFEVHDRGSILTSAVFNAFLKIVDRRTADLIRIATSGTGNLPEGALHPDLVNRLTHETCKAAKHVLRMCIRALDYCPAVDITFGEYLRALITADIDLVANDKHYYRVAFMEAFREKDLLPRDMRTISEETLAWGTMQNPNPDWLQGILNGLDLGWGRDLTRSEIFKLNEYNRWAMWRALKQAFAADPTLFPDFGLIKDVPRYREDGTVIKQPRPGGTTFEVFSVRPARRVGPDGSCRTEVIATIQQRQVRLLDPNEPKGEWFWFRGGTTLILDPREGHREVRYSIVKRSDSTNRLDRQRSTVKGGQVSPLRALYFGKMPGEPFAMMHADYGAHHHG